MFSSRLPEDLAANRVTQTLDRLRAAGTPIVDLTETNPTRVALRYPPDSLEPLANRAGLIYEPPTFGYLLLVRRLRPRWPGAGTGGQRSAHPHLEHQRSVLTALQTPV